MRINRWDIMKWLTFGVFFGLGLLAIYGAFWWFNTYVMTLAGLTIVEALDLPVLDLAFAVASIWVVPGLAVGGLGIIIGLGKAILE